MRAFVITFVALNVVVLIGELAKLGSARPWPRERKPESASTSVVSVVFAAAMIAWGAWLISRSY